MWQNRELKIKSLFLYNHLIFGKSAMQLNEERRILLLHYAEATKYAHKKKTINSWPLTPCQTQKLIQSSS